MDIRIVDYVNRIQRNRGTSTLGANLVKYEILCITFCCFFLGGCSRYDSALERALVLAKDNRSELERVLAFYDKDSLKLEAAKFLIKNMPGHFSYQGDEIEQYYDAMDSILQIKQSYSTIALADTMENVWRQIATMYNYTPDIEIIKADYLIENIDDAFHQWENGSWSTHVSFQDFCEFILPYKVIELQPLDKWRSYLKKQFSEGLDKLQYCYWYKNSAIWATHCINSNMKDSLKPNLLAYQRPPIHRLSTKLQMPFGVCNDYVEIAAAVLRSEGVPVAIDFTPQWPSAALGHSWNVVLANSGKKIPFSGVESNPGEPHKLDEKMAKVYRKTYAINPEMEELLKSERSVPNTLKSLFIKDVTNEYMVTDDVEIEVNDIACNYAYLAVFNNKFWIPIAFGSVRNHKAVFKDMGRNVLYLPVGYADNSVIPIGAPFVLTSNGKIKKVVPQREHLQEVTLYRKYPLLPHVQNAAHRIVGGKFQASNSASFEDNVTLHEVQDWGVKGVEISLHMLKESYRYWRYYQPDGDHYCNIAEIAFIDRASHKPIVGRIIGTNGYYGNDSNNRKEAVFDGDLLTFFDAPIANDGWVGMDFGHPIAVEKIIYSPRGDGNTICIGDRYELFYWNDNCWTSLGNQVASTTSLHFKNVPTNALYLLRNLSGGAEERIFLYKNGEQEFW